MGAPWNGNIGLWKFENEEILLLIEKTEYQKPGSRPRYRLPGGKKKGADKDPFESMVRELKEETGFEIDEGADVKFVAHLDVSTEHFQEFFMAPASDCRGTFNPGPYTDKDGNTVTFVWVSIKEATTVVNGRPFLFGNHHYIACEIQDRLERMLGEAPKQALACA